MRKIYFGVAGVAAAAFAAAMVLPGSAPAQEATLYKDPNCGCCAHYATYMRNNGFDVTVKLTDDIGAVTAEAGVPARLQSCHVTMVDGYVVSGHVPVDSVRRMLEERPAVQGITLPGMPAGSPGMGGMKAGPWNVFGFGGSGGPSVYSVE